MSPKRTTPVIFQMEATECGAACFAMIMAAHGAPITLDEARAACSTARDGVDAARIIVAAGSYGLEAHGLRREPEQLAQLALPVILHWNFDHFVVLTAIRNGRFVLHDPAQGLREVTAQEFGDAFTGIVLTFAPGPQFKRRPAPPSTFALLLAEARCSPDVMALSALLGLAALPPAIALTGAIGVFADHVVGQSREVWGAFVLLAVAVVVGLQFALALANGRIVASLQAKIATHVAARGFWAALFLPGHFYAQRNAGELVARLRLGSEVGQVVAGPLASVVPNLVATIGYLGILALYSPMIAAVVALVSLVNLALMVVLARRVGEADAAFQIADGFAAGASTAGLAALDIYRLHGRETVLVDRIATAEDRALDREQRIGVLRAIGLAAPVASAALLTGLVLCLGALEVMNGSMTLGGLLAAQMIAGLLNTPIVALAAAGPQMQEAAGAYTRLEDLRRHPPAAAFRPDQPLALPTEIRGMLRLSKVSFGYTPDSTLLHDISIDLQPGRLVAVMGASGGGKSTLAKIIAGMLDGASGRVELDGVELASWPQDLLRRALVYLPQDAAVFTGSIHDNITLWDTDLSDADVVAAAARVGLVPVLAARPGGLQARLAGHAPTLSGGERQRLALARALVRKPAVLILDEAMSALDVASERALLAELRATGAAVFLVTHRISAAQDCDEVIVLDGGHVVARGDPRQLLQAAPRSAAPAPTANPAETARRAA